MEEDDDEKDAKRRELQRKPSLRMKSVRRASFDADPKTDSFGEDVDMQSDNEDGDEEKEEEEEEEEPAHLPRRSSLTSQSAEIYRRNSYREAIETFKLANVYQENKAKQLAKWGGKAERKQIAR